MSYNYNNSNGNPNNQMLLEVKSKYDAEFRRFGLNRYGISKFEEFYALLERLHGLNGIQFNICYTDKDGDLLPINNDMNLARVLQVTIGILRLIIQRKGECYNNDYNFASSSSNHQSSNNNHSFNTTNGGSYYYNNNNNTNLNSSNTSSSSASYRASNLISQIKSLKDLSATLTNPSSNMQTGSNNKPFLISYPEDFRPVSAIIDVDILPDTYRRVRLHKHKSSKPLGFYIRDGRSLRVTPHGVEQVPGIFISRLMPGGLAESTGLLSVNDEVIEVNGIEVAGKTLDQVTDMMVANSSNLIITVKPTNQRYNLNRSTGNNTTVTSSNSQPSMINLNKPMLPPQLPQPPPPSHPQQSSNPLNRSSSIKKNTSQQSVAASSVNSSIVSSSSQPAKQQLHQTSQTKLLLSNENDTSNNKNQANNEHEEDDEEEQQHAVNDHNDDDDDDDDDDEEIHDITNHNNSSDQDQDNSDDKILTL